jgi:hypothetical protein
MKKLLRLIPLVGIFINVQFSEAQTCSATDKQTLKDCVVVGVEACRSTSTCNDFQPALTINDVAGLAIATCCAKRTKSSRSLCLVKESKKYSPKVSSGQQKAFFRAARAEIKRLKNSVCKNSPYSLAASSALF